MEPRPQIQTCHTFSHIIACVDATMFFHFYLISTG